METKVCKIYKLFNSMSDKFYIGSTFTEIRYRLNKGHKQNFRHWIKNNKKGKYMSSYIILEEVKDLKNVKWEEVYREEIKIEKNDNKKEMKLQFDRKKRGIERKFILKFKEECGDRCVNKHIPFEGSDKEYRKEYQKTDKYKNYIKTNEEKIKKYKKDYYKKNKKNILQKHKDYNLINKEKIAKQRKEYREKHKEQAKEYMKEYRKLNKYKEYRQMYRIKNKEAISQRKKEKIECPLCGSFVRKSDIRKHQRTKKCLKAQSNN